MVSEVPGEYNCLVWSLMLLRSKVTHEAASQLFDDDGAHDQPALTLYIMTEIIKSLIIFTIIIVGRL